MVFITIFSISTSQANERILSDAAWREDINLVAAEIRQNHPNPFKTISEKEFDNQVSTLLGDVQTLSDKNIIVQLASIVASVNDSHTRLAIPREHPGLGLEFGHKGTPAPNNDGLEFKQMPVSFAVFEDGIFVTGSTKKLRHLIGRKLLTIGTMSAKDALKKVQLITFSENKQLEKLMGADRLSLPEALNVLGIIDDPREIMLTLEQPSGAVDTINIVPLRNEPFEWITALRDLSLPHYLNDVDKKHWWKYLESEQTVYAKINEIGDGEIRLVEFAATIVKEAEKRDAKLVIDLRHNFGGSNDLNVSLVQAIVKSDELNQFGRTFVLTGRRTFSAAQHLVNNLEQYTRTIFVGEPTGAPPDHFGDSSKTRLPNSGLTLRVSSLHWSSYLANDDRKSTIPDLLISWTSAAYFSGEDPALSAAVNFKYEELQSILRLAFNPFDESKIYRYLTLSLRSPDTYHLDLAPTLIELGREFLSSDEFENADIAYQIGLYFYPDHIGLKKALAAIQASDE
jgi:hypothetical protein